MTETPGDYETMSDPQPMSNADLRQLCQANAIAIAQTNQGIRDLKASVELLTQSTDDAAAEAVAAERKVESNERRSVELRADFISAREKSDQRFNDLMAKSEADREKWQANFDAQQEVLQRLLLEIRSTNGEVKQLGDRVEKLEAG